MRLDRANVTTASRIMLPIYPVMLGLLGLNYVTLGDAEIAASPLFSAIEDDLSVRAWGLGFLVVAAALGFALIAHRRAVYIGALALMIALMLLWAVVFEIAALFGLSSPGAALWPAFAACSAFASMVSVQRREISVRIDDDLGRP